MIKKGRVAKKITDAQWLIQRYEEKPHMQRKLCELVYKQFESFIFLREIDERKPQFIHWLYLRFTNVEHPIKDKYVYQENTSRATQLLFV